MNYGEVLASAARIIWKHKLLWLFGFLAGGLSGITYFVATLANYFFSPDLLISTYPSSSGSEELANALILYFLITFGAFGLITIVAYIVQAFSLGGLIRGVRLADQGAGELELRGLFSACPTYFWRVLGMLVLFGVGIGAVIGILYCLISVLSLATFGLAFLCFLPLIIALIPVSFLVGAFLQQAVISLVVDDLGIGAGLQRGWSLIRNKFVPMLLMSLILGFGQSILTGVFSSPYVFISWFRPFLGESGNVLLITTVVELLYTPILIFLLSLSIAYLFSAWTLTYLRLTRLAAVKAAD